MKYRQVLFDPGHGGHDPGAVEYATGRKESDDVLRLYKACKQQLSQCAVTVLSTRENDTFIPLYKRPQLANDIGVNLLVSLHRNSAAPGNTTAHGIEIWVHPNAPTEDVTIATHMLAELSKTPIQQNRGIKYGSYAVLTCRAPAVMLELGFMNNPKDHLLFDKHITDYATAIAKSICHTFSVPYLPPEPPNDNLYRIQLGAFYKQEHARAYLTFLQDQGFSPYLVPPKKKT